MVRSAAPFEKFEKFLWTLMTDGILHNMKLLDTEERVGRHSLVAIGLSTLLM